MLHPTVRASHVCFGGQQLNATCDSWLWSKGPSTKLISAVDVSEEDYSMVSDKHYVLRYGGCLRRGVVLDDTS